MINGNTMRDAIISASNNIFNNRKKVDELNVFPVPDGDTGTNMSMTISAAARELAVIPDGTPVSKVMSVAANALLRGARGNSGVILSLLFRGLSKGFKEKAEIDGVDFANALVLGVKAAYKAVMQPTEGTILTVSRLASDAGIKKAEQTNDTVEVLEAIIEGANDALEKTPEQLPVLKKAGVVDAGGKGFIIILDGMLSVFKNSVIIGSGAEVTTESTDKSDSEAKEEEKQESSKYCYCTEYTIEKDSESSADIIKLRAYLEAIGEQVNVSEGKKSVKVHVHTNDPGNAIQRGLRYGILSNVKVQYKQCKAHKFEGEKESKVFTAAPEKKYGFVAVAAGDGVCNLFTELGVDNIVKGGQTMNPSTDDILKAVEATPAENVFVLPNNKNIIMAAEQVIPISSKAVSVLHTKTIPQGLTAMLSFDELAEPKANHINMMKAAGKVSTALVTFAARNSNYDGQSIKQGEILGIENGKVALVESDIVKAAYKCVKHIYKKGNSIVTIIYGNGATESQANAVAGLLSAKFGNEVDIAVVEGGQPIYYFIISVE